MNAQKGMASLLVALALTACAPKGEELYARAQQALEKGEVQAAIIDLKNLVKDEPTNAKARTLLAVALSENDEFGAAAIEVQKAKDLGAPPEALLVPECRVMTARREFEAVLEKCRPEAVADISRPDIQVALGRALFGLGRASEAKPQFEAALAARPDSLDALLGLAQSVYEIEGLDAGMAVLDGAGESVRKESAYWMSVGGLNTQSGSYAAAETAYEKALANAGADATDRLMALGALAETQMRQGKVTEATATAEQLAKAAPNNPVVKMLQGQVLAAGGKLSEARTLLEEAVAAMPDSNQARTALGMVNLQQGNLGQAEMHFENVVAKDPKDMRAQRLLAETRARLQSPEQSLAALAPALAGGDADPALLAMAGRMSLASGKREQALEYFAQAAGASAGSKATDVQLEVANGYLLAGDFAQAVAVLEKLPATTGSGYQREYLLMVALLRKGESERAVAEAQALVKRAGSDPQARVLAAGVFASTGRLDEARRELGEALKLKPDDAATVVNLARIDLLEGKTAAAEQGFRKALANDPKNLQAMLGMAAAAGSRNDRIEARKWLQQASVSHPDSVEAQLAVGQYYAGTRDFEHSKAVLDAAVEKWPDNAVVVNARGLAQLGLGDAAGAVTSFKQATTLAPKAYGFMMNLAGAHAAGGNIDGALAVLNDLLRAQPAYVPALTLAARLTLGTGQVEKAAGYVARLRNSAPEAANTHALEGDLAMAQKRYRDALQDYRKASASGMTSQLALAQYEAARRAGEPKPEQVLVDWVARNPGDGAAVIALAEARHGAGDVDGAIALYERSVEVLPANAALLNNLAVLYDRKGDPRATDFAERANQAAPNSPPIQDTYGWILFRQGKTGRAVELLRAAHKGLPDNAEVQYHLAAVLAEQGDTAAAVELLKKAVRGPMPEDQKVAAQQLLQKLSN